jgi:O-antigen/teichoic acid export membrane protein
MTPARVPRFAQAKVQAAAPDSESLFEADGGFDLAIDPVDATPSASGSASEQQAENRSAAKNGAMLGASLLFTATTGVLVSLFFVPNMVGERDTGILGFGEALATLSLVVAGFGMDTYLRKEVATREDHANRLFASILFLRLLASGVLTAVALGVLVARNLDISDGVTWTSGTFGTTLLVVLLFCGAQFFQQTAESYAALLQAVGQVRQQSRLTVRTKVGWALMVVAGLGAGLGIWIVPLALLLTEAIKTIVLGVSAQRVFDIEWKLHLREAWPMIKAGSPFLVTAVSVKVISWLDVALVRLITGDDAETGYYHVALRISALALLLAPLVQWVVLPMAARAAERSRADFAELVRRSFQWVLCGGVPLSVLLLLNADVLISTALPEFTPSIQALRILSCVIALAYVTMLGATLLIADGRSWRVVRITFITIAVDAVFNLYLIRHAWMWWGMGDGALKDGGAGIGAAMSLVAAEAIGATLMAYELRRVVRRLSDAESRRAVASMLAVCVAVAVVDRLCQPLGAVRPVVDLVVMVGLLTAVGIIRRSWYVLVLSRLGLVKRQGDLPGPVR